MSDHVFDEIPQLLTGDADRSTVALVATHLRECTDCRDELVEAIAAHAALMSASRFASGRANPLSSASESDLVGSEISAPADLSALFAQVRAEVDAAPPAAPTHRPRRVWLAAAAAVVVLAGGGGATYLAINTGGSQPARTLALSAFGDGTNSASAKLIGDDQMSLDASSLPRLASGSYYEVWLTNGARTAMAPVGVLNGDRKATITVPASEMTSYAAIEVSVQKTDGVGSYSGHSVLRGTYA